MNGFARHPRLTLFTIVSVAGLLLVIATERTLAALDGATTQTGAVHRYIRLREHAPGSRRLARPSDHAVRCSTGLAARDHAIDADADGFVAPSKIHDAPELSVVFLGGSTTECLFVDPEARWPYLVGRTLEQRTGERTNAYNGGVAGNTTLHALNILLAKGVPLHPDVAVLHENINDLVVLLRHGTYWNESPWRSVVGAQTAAPPTLGEAVQSAFHAVLPFTAAHVEAIGRDRSEKDEFADVRGQRVARSARTLVAEYERNLRWFVDVCRDAGITPVLMTQASRLTEADRALITCSMAVELDDAGADIDELLARHRDFNETIRRVGAEMRVDVIDLDRRIPRDAAYLYDTVHYTAAGARLAADVISEGLLGVLDRRAHGAR